MKLLLINDLSVENLKIDLTGIFDKLKRHDVLKGTVNKETKGSFNYLCKIWNNTVDSSCLDSFEGINYDVPRISKDINAPNSFCDLSDTDVIENANQVLDFVRAALDALEKAVILKNGPVQPNSNSPIGFGR